MSFWTTGAFTVNLVDARVERWPIERPKASGFRIMRSPTSITEVMCLHSVPGEDVVSTRNGEPGLRSLCRLRTGSTERADRGYTSAQHRTNTRIQAEQGIKNGGAGFRSLCLPIANRPLYRVSYTPSMTWAVTQEPNIRIQAAKSINTIKHTALSATQSKF